jgi:hypothetical protein
MQPYFISMALPTSPVTSRGAINGLSLANCRWHELCFVWGHTVRRAPPRRGTMLWAIAVVFVLLWALAMVSSCAFGGFVHLLMVAAVVMIAYQMIQNHRDNKFKKGV